MIKIKKDQLDLNPFLHCISSSSSKSRSCILLNDRSIIKTNKHCYRSFLK